MSDGVQVVAMDAEDLETLFPKDSMSGLVRSLVEVCERISICGRKSHNSHCLQEEDLPHSFTTFLIYLTSTVYRFQPTHILFHDSLPLKLTSLMALPSHVRREFIIYTAEQLPFGPFAGGLTGGSCSSHEHELLQQVDAIWSVSEKIQNYAAEHGGLAT